MALNITINKVAVAASFAVGATVATAVATGGTAPYVYSLATGSDKFAINSSTGIVTTIANMDASNIASFSVTATDSTTGTPLTSTSDITYPPIQAAIQSKFNKSSVIYKITKPINLYGGVLTIPEGCTLDFQGGSFSNGIIKINSGSNVYLNGGTLTNCTLDLSNNDRIVQDVTISNGILKVSGNNTAILAVNTSTGLYSQDIRIENIWIEGDTDNSSSANINKCKGIYFKNSWINYLHNVKIQHCGTALTIENSNAIKCSQCTFRWNGLHILHTSGGSNVFQNGDMEQGFHLVDIYAGDLKLLNSYIEAHTDGRGINIKGNSKLTIKDSHLLSSFIGINSDCTLIIKDNIFDFQGNSSNSWYGITFLSDVNSYVIIEGNDFTEPSCYFIRVTPSYMLAYFNGTSFVSLSSCKERIVQHRVDINGYIGDVVYDNTTIQKVPNFINFGTYNRVAVEEGDVSVSSTSPNGSVIMNAQGDNKPNLFYKNAQGNITALGIPYGTVASIQNPTNVKTGLYFGTDTKTLYTWGNGIWTSLLNNLSGVTANRPTGVPVGSIYFDTTLGKPIFLKDATPTWIDASGATV